MTCTSAPAVAMSFTCTAACMRHAASPVPVPIPSPKLLRSPPKVAAWSRRVAGTAMDGCGPARSGLAKCWLRQPLRPPSLPAGACDLLLSIGTSGVVQPAASIPRVALQAGAVVVHVNPQPAGHDGRREFSLTGAAGQVLPELLRRLEP